MVTLQNNSSVSSVKSNFIDKRTTHIGNGTATNFNTNFIKQKSRLAENQHRLNLMANLKKGWDGEQANPIPVELIRRLKLMIMHLDEQPQLQPTADGTIQLEYEKPNRDYLEIEVNGNIMEIFVSLSNGEEVLTTAEVSPERLNQELVKFYGQSNSL